MNQGQHIHLASDPVFEAITSIITPEDRHLLKENGLMTEYSTGAFLPSEAASIPGTKEERKYSFLVITAFKKKENQEPLTPLENAAYHQVIAMHAGTNLTTLLGRIWGAS